MFLMYVFKCIIIYLVMRNCVMVAQQTLTLFVRVRILLPQPYFFEVWLSLVERYVRDVEAAGSTPVTSTISESNPSFGFGFNFNVPTLKLAFGTFPFCYLILN